MPIASLTHAALSAAAVGILLYLLRRAGARAAGLAAAVPINSLPALFWLAQRQGEAFAASAALGALAGTALTVVLGAGFVRLAEARDAAAPHVAASGAALRPPTWGDVTLLSMATAGAMSLLVSALARHAGPQTCGLVAAVPVVGLLATRAGWRRGGVAAMLGVVRGYLDGMAAKAAFLATLGAAWTLDAGGWAWPLGLVAAVLALRARRPRREGTTPLPPRRGPAPTRPPHLATANLDAGSVR